MLAVVGELEIFDANLFQGVDKGVDGAISFSGNDLFLAIQRNRRFASHLVFAGLFDGLVGYQLERGVILQEFPPEYLVDFLDGEFAGLGVRGVVDDQTQPRSIARRSGRDRC